MPSIAVSGTKDPPTVLVCNNQLREKGMENGVFSQPHTAALSATAGCHQPFSTLGTCLSRSRLLKMYSTSLTSPRDICADRTALSQKEATLHIYVHLPINGFSGAIPWNSFTPNTALTSPHSVTGIRCFTRRRGSYSSYSHHSCWENYWEGSKDAYKPDRILD